jgi:CRP-like cAMP-binding protein
MAAIIDTAPETVSRILGHLRRQHLLDDRQRQVASFSPRGCARSNGPPA